MNPQERLERVLKDLGCLAEVFRCASIAASTLEDKLIMQKAQNSMQAARHDCRVLYYTVEDAERLEKKTERCPQCQTVVVKTA